MSKEAVTQIRKAIEDAQRAKDLREQQEAERKKAEALRLEREHQALIDRNEARLRVTGVVGLFEELRESKVLTMSKAGDPAEIKWNSDRTKILIEFDEHSVHWLDPQDDHYFPPQTESKYLSATILMGGQLVIGEHTVKRGERLGNVVKDEILRLKGLK